MLADTGLKTQHNLLISLRAAGQSPPILDARLLLEDPAECLVPALRTARFTF